MSDAIAVNVDLLPARMLNEFTYCPRLAYLEWVQGEWDDNPDTLDGEFVHRNVDRDDRRGVKAPAASNSAANSNSAAAKCGGGEADADDGADGNADAFHARSLRLADEGLGLVAVIDIVEVEGAIATPVDYKKAKAPDLPEGAWEPERVQLCAQGLLLRSAGYVCNEGVIWFAGSRRRVRIKFDDALVARTRQLITEARAVAAGGRIPLPLVDSPKCPRCSLVSICLPDEVNCLRDLANTSAEPYSTSHIACPSSLAPCPLPLAPFPKPLAPDPEPRPLAAEINRFENESKYEKPRAAIRQLLSPRPDARPFYVSEPGAKVGKSAERLIVELKGEKLGEVRLADVSHLCLFGPVQVSAQALHELADRDIPVCHFSGGGWFRGITTGLSHKNVEVRIRQYAAAASDSARLSVARAFVAAKIRNGRTLLRRNGGEDVRDTLAALHDSALAAENAVSLPELLGIEGMAAKRYFAALGMLLKDDHGFALEGRNRRPPTDPVNALLSFLYALLAKELTIATQAAGLDPMLGFLHAPRYGRPSLALDLAEEFRPLLADSVVLSLVNTGEVRPEHFVRRATGVGLTGAGRRTLVSAWERRLNADVTHPIFNYTASYRRVLMIQARLLARHLLGEIPEYPAFKTR